jgi:hypothetical protein
MCDKCEKNIELEQQEFANEQECQEDPLIDASSDDRFIELTIEQEFIRMSKEIVLDTTDVSKHPQFEKGVQEGLLLAGFYNALVSCGISNKMAEDMSLNKQTCDHNQLLQEMNNKVSLEISKVQAVQIDKAQV